MMLPKTLFAVAMVGLLLGMLGFAARVDDEMENVHVEDATSEAEHHGQGQGMETRRVSHSKHETLDETFGCKDGSETGKGQKCSNDKNSRHFNSCCPGNTCEYERW